MITTDAVEQQDVNMQRGKISEKCFESFVWQCLSLHKQYPRFPSKSEISAVIQN